MHPAAYNFVRGERDRMPPGLIVEIGALNINGSIRELFANCEYVGVDVVPGPGVDVVADGAEYVPPVAPGVVLCCEVLEHTPRAKDICANAYRMLQPGGIAIFTMAGEGRAPHSAVDGGTLRPNEFYRNVTAEAIAEWFKPFERVTVTINPIAKDVYVMGRKPVVES